MTRDVTTPLTALTLAGCLAGFLAAAPAPTPRPPAGPVAHEWQQPPLAEPHWPAVDETSRFCVCHKMATQMQRHAEEVSSKLHLLSATYPALRESLWAAADAAEHARQAWWELGRAADWYAADPAKYPQRAYHVRWHLQALRERLGEEDFYAGRMPQAPAVWVMP